MTTSTQKKITLFKEIRHDKIDENFIHLIGKQWMLLTCGTKDSFNTMTANWGGVGVLWNFPVSFIFIRPTRFTFQFAETNAHYTLCFFDRSHKDILSYCGAHSGKEVDKIKETGLIPAQTKLGNIYFEQAKLVIECSKLYAHDLDPENFKNRLIGRNYPNKDYHRMYIGKIVSCLAKNDG